MTPAEWRDRISPFAPPPSNLAIEFPDVTVLDCNSCSACQSTLLLFLAKHRERLLECLPSEDSVYVAIGRGHSEVPEGTLCLGNCTSDQKDRGVFVPGCPPVGSEILKAILARRPPGARGAGRGAPRPSRG